MSTPSSHATTLLDHVRELQFRLLASVAVLLVGGVIGYILYDPIFQLLRTPLHSPLYYSSPAGSFLFVMKISLLVAVIFALPVIIYNLIMFIRPAFKENLGRTRVYLTTIGSITLAAIGATFAFIVILPASIKFFVGFQVTGLSALLDASTYLNFVVNILISFILVFQLPLIIGFIDHIKPIPPKKLLKMEKWVVIGGLVIGVLAPFSFDPTTELLIAAPIIVLFNLSIAMIALQHAYTRSVARKAAKREAKHAANAKKVLERLEKARPIIPSVAVTAASEPTSVLTNSFLEDDLQALIEESEVAEATPTVVASPAALTPTAKKWMDIAPTASRTNQIVLPKRTPPISPVMPRPEVTYQRPRLISDIF